jgi:hypothetical protein
MSSLVKYQMVEASVLHLRDAGDALMYADGENGESDLNKPIRVHLFGPGSKQYAKAQAAQQNRWIERLKRKGKVDETAEEKMREEAEFLAQVTHSFENIDDAPLDVYTDRLLSFIPKQVRAFVDETSNFTKASTTS